MRKGPSDLADGPSPNALTERPASAFTTDLTSANGRSASLGGTDAAVSAAISPVRLAPYLDAAGGGPSSAIRLYHWNIELSAAVYELLHFFEVALRNAMDSRLSTWNASQVDGRTGRERGRDWLLDPAPLLVRLVREKDIKEALRRAEISARRRTGPRRRAPVEHEDILANLSLGTWRYLLPDKDAGRRLLWDQALTHAFPSWSRAASDLTRAVDGILLLRNRVAHLEPLLNTDSVRAQLTNCRLVLDAIDPAVAQWAMSWQRITRTIDDRP